MIILGTSMAIIAVLMLFGYLTGGVGFIVSIVIALVMFVVGYFKTDDIQKWLDRVTDFGHNKSGERFSSLVDQMDGLVALSNQED